MAAVYKKGERSNPANYRPISLTCIICKTLEHIVASSIRKHLSKLNIFYELQHGFREKRSALVNPSSSCWSMIFSNPSIRKSKMISFDKVSHEKLALKQHDYGIRGPALKWIKGFLDNRHQSVIVNGSSSEPIPVSSGVPRTTSLSNLHK